MTSQSDAMSEIMQFEPPRLFISPEVNELPITLVTLTSHTPGCAHNLYLNERPISIMNI